MDWVGPSRPSMRAVTSGSRGSIGDKSATSLLRICLRYRVYQSPGKDICCRFIGQKPPDFAVAEGFNRIKDAERGIRACFQQNLQGLQMPISYGEMDRRCVEIFRTDQAAIAIDQAPKRGRVAGCRGSDQD